MKRIFFIALGFVCLTAWATDYTAYGKMTLKAKNSGTTAALMFFEAPTFVYGPAYDDGGDTPEIMTGQAMYFYVIGSDNNYKSFADTLFLNEPIGFQGPAGETEFSIIFTNWFSNSGKVFKLYDKQENKFIDVMSTPSYDFTISTAGASITDRFILEPVFNFQVCAYKDYVEITGNEGTDNIVITNMAGDTVVNVPPVAIYQSINLLDKDAGHYILTVNGKQYEFCNKPVSNN